jgi:chemotaxis protein methyltransferase CheR
MKDSECVPFLQWALLRLGMRWSGIRKVRRQVRRRLHKRLHQLGLENAQTYRNFLKAHPAEWKTFDTLCEITISRFFRSEITAHSSAAPLECSAGRRYADPGNSGKLTG